MSDESTPSAETTAEQALPDGIEAGQDGGQEAADEGKPGDAPPKKKTRTADELMSAAIGKKQRVNRERKALAAEKEAFARERAATSERLTKADRLEQALARAKDDPSALSEFGVSYDDWTAKLLAAGTPDAKIELLEKKLNAAEALREKRERLEQEREQAEHDTRAIGAYVTLSRSGDFPETELHNDKTIAQMGEVVGQELSKTLGRAASHREIAADVERQLVELEVEKATARAAREAKKAGSSPTLTNRLGTESTGKRRELSKDEHEKDVAASLGSWFTGGGALPVRAWVSLSCRGTDSPQSVSPPPANGPVSRRETLLRHRADLPSDSLPALR